MPRVNFVPGCGRKGSLAQWDGSLPVRSSCNTCAPKELAQRAMERSEKPSIQYMLSNRSRDCPCGFGYWASHDGCPSYIYPSFSLSAPNPPLKGKDVCPCARCDPRVRRKDMARCTQTSSGHAGVMRHPDRIVIRIDDVLPRVPPFRCKLPQNLIHASLQTTCDVAPITRHCPPRPFHPGGR